MKLAFKNLGLRIGFGVVLFLLLNWFYATFFFKSDIEKFAPIRPTIIESFKTGDIVYMGESSNTSFNPWTDTLNQSIGDFLQLYLPENKVTQISHESFHLGLFKDMLKLREPTDSSKTIAITLNMRTFGPSAIYSGTEASNQQEALFYSKRFPLLTRIFLSLHFYDNRGDNERTRLKFKQWRTAKPNVLHKLGETSAALSNAPQKLKNMADAFVKEFMFNIDESNPRVKDLKEIIAFGKKNNLRIIFHILPENREYTESLIGTELALQMDKNIAFLENILKESKTEYLSNYSISSYTDYTDQFYPTEHVNTRMRKAIAFSIGNYLNSKIPKESLNLKANNFPNWSIHQPMADTLVSTFGLGPNIE